jgi:hypothetical protein
LSGRGAATALSDVSLFGDAIGLIRCLVGSPLFPAFPCSLLSRRRNCRLGCSSRRWGRSGSGLSGRSAAAALSYVSLLRNAVGLIGGLIGAPFFPTRLCSLLPGHSFFRFRGCNWRCCWGFGRCGWRSAAAALGNISLLRNAVGLISGLIGSPLLPTLLCSFLLGYDG